MFHECMSHVTPRLRPMSTIATASPTVIADGAFAYTAAAPRNRFTTEITTRDTEFAQPAVAIYWQKEQTSAPRAKRDVTPARSRRERCPQLCRAKKRKVFHVAASACISSPSCCSKTMRARLRTRACR